MHFMPVCTYYIYLFLFTVCALLKSVFIYRESVGLFNAFAAFMVCLCVVYGSGRNVHLLQYCTILRYFSSTSGHLWYFI